MGFQWQGAAVPGCDTATCAFRPGWACSQPEDEGPIPIPGPGDSVFMQNGIAQGWGEVPYNATVRCWCANDAGTLANVSDDCVAQACPFPGRCVAAWPQAPTANGTVCAAGADGPLCTVCITRWYKFRDECRPCPTGVPIALILLGIGVGVVVLVVGPMVAQLASPASIALLRSLVMYLQYLSLSLDIRLRWPPALLRVFSWLKALTDGIDLAAPECVATNWTYKLYVQLLFAGLGALFAAALLMHEAARLWQRFIVFRDPATHGEANVARLSRLNALWRRCNDLKQFAALSVQFFYIYVTGLLLQAWDCIDTPEGSKLRSDPGTDCSSASHHAFRRIAICIVVVVGPGVPLVYTFWLRRLRAVALRQRELMRPAWRGLGDPATRAAWGGLYAVRAFPSRPDCAC